MKVRLIQFFYNFLLINLFFPLFFPPVIFLIFSFILLGLDDEFKHLSLRTGIIVIPNVKLASNLIENVKCYICERNFNQIKMSKEFWFYNFLVFFFNLFFKYIVKFVVKLFVENALGKKELMIEEDAIFVF